MKILLIDQVSDLFTNYLLRVSLKKHIIRTIKYLIKTSLEREQNIEDVFKYMGRMLEKEIHMSRTCSNIKNNTKGKQK